MKILSHRRRGLYRIGGCARCNCAGHSVVNVDKLTYAACLDNVKSVADNENYVFFQADICDRAAMDAS